MSFRKPCHMPFRKLIPPFTLNREKVIDNNIQGIANLKNLLSFSLESYNLLFELITWPWRPALFLHRSHLLYLYSPGRAGVKYK